MKIYTLVDMDREGAAEALAEGKIKNLCKTTNFFLHKENAKAVKKTMKKEHGYDSMKVVSFNIIDSYFLEKDIDLDKYAWKV
jgi:hypothetical protein|tara:strand:- start:442 stop:687 length:246 start_codon:yes stop_codon:yes gene_type:complete